MTGLPVTRGGEALSVAGGAYIGATGLALVRAPRPGATVLLLVAGVIAAGGAAVGMSWGASRPRARLLLGAAILGTLGAAVRVVLLPADPPPSAAGIGPTFSGIVRQGPLPGGRDQLVVDVAPTDGGVPAAVLVRLRAGSGGTGGSSVRAGDSVTVNAARVGPLTTTAQGGHPRSRDDAVELAATGATVQRTSSGGGVGHLVDGIRAGLCDLVDSQLPAPIGTVFLGVVVGLRRPLPATLNAAFQATGLIHLLVLSGLKVAVLTRCLRRVCDALSVSRSTRVLMVLPAITGYVLLGGAGPAATRSALMAAAALLFARDGRRVDALPLLALTGIGVLSHDPRAVLTVGFQLSYAGTAGIILLADPIAARLRGPGVVRDAIAATLAAQLATLPITASTFGVVSLVGPVANALALPLLPLVVMVGGAGAVLAAVDPALGWLPLHAAALACLGLTHLTEALAAVPGAALVVGATGATCLLAVPLLLSGLVARAWTRRLDDRPGTGWRPLPRPAHPGSWLGVPAGLAALLALTAGVWLLSTRPDGRLHVTVLEAGDGVAVLVRTPAGATVLVDAGSNPTALGSSLGAELPLYANGLDGLVLTGAGRRIGGGVGALLPQHPVGLLLVPDVELGNALRTSLLALRDGGAQAQTLPPGGTWRWGDAVWRCLPVNPSVDAAARAACAVQVATPDGSLLVLGDLDPGAQEELAAGAGAGLRSRLLVAAPGGALSPALITAVAPERIVIPGVARGTRLAELAHLQVDRLAGHSRGYVVSPTGVKDT